MRESKVILVILISLFLSVAILGTAIGADVTLAWDDPNSPEVGVEGYTLYWGEDNPPTTVLDVGKVLTATIPNLAVGNTYYFALDAYNAYGNSGKSDILEYTIPAPSMVIKIPQPPSMKITISLTYP